VSAGKNPALPELLERAQQLECHALNVQRDSLRGATGEEDPDIERLQEQVIALVQIVKDLVATLGGAS
jgi:hypothetical protein